MNEQQAQRWMKTLASAPNQQALPQAERIWMLAQLEAAFEERRALAAPLAWIETAVQSFAGVATVVLVCWFAVAA